MARRASRPAGPPESAPVPTPPKQVPVTARMKQRAIVFVGPMAAGKTSVGKRVAKELGVPFIDTDSQIVQAHGPISEIFDKRGEAEFRRIEASVVAREVSEPGVRVVSLGGGAVLSDHTRALLRDYSVVLLMTTEEAIRRTANLAKRPLLRDDPGAWSRILEERRHLYEEVAQISFRTDRMSKEELTRRIVRWVTNTRGVTLPNAQEAKGDSSRSSRGGDQKGSKSGRPRRRRGRRGRRQNPASKTQDRPQERNQ